MEISKLWRKATAHMLQLSATFDLQQDVVSSIFKKEATVGMIKGKSYLVVSLDRYPKRILCGFTHKVTMCDKYHDSSDTCNGKMYFFHYRILRDR